MNISKDMAMRFQFVAAVLLCFSVGISFSAPQIHAQPACTLVELYPGYPGYRGMITGLKGIGDFQCLEVLNDRNPNFNRAIEDRENYLAGMRLGIRGTFKEWTWENWMEIEIERGKTPQCYACLLFNTSMYAQPNGATVEPDDPRLLLGMTIGSYLENYILTEFGSRSSSTTHEGIYWRVAAAFAYPDSTLNAPDTLEAVRFLVGEWSGHDVNGDGQWSSLTMSTAFETFESRGGYVRMTGLESYDDQLYQAMAAAYLMVDGSAPGMPQQGTGGMYEGAITSCKFKYGEYKTIGHCVAAMVEN
jgi:hypothetical protein